MANDFLSRDNEWAWEVEFICSNGKTLKRKQRTIWNDKKLLFPHVFCSKVLNEICFCKVFVRKPLKTLTWSSSTTETAKAFDHSWLLLTLEWANDRLERSNNISFSVNRFGEISHLQSIWVIFWMVYLVFGKRLYVLWRFYALAQIVIVVNGQSLNNSVAIWSHWSPSTSSCLFDDYYPCTR